MNDRLGSVKETKAKRESVSAQKKAGAPVWALVLAASAMWACFFGHLDALGLVGPDEPRYASVARAMAVTGDWVTPRLDGEPWFEKPVLYYWAAGGAMKIFGEGEFAARLPSALAAMLAVLAVVWAGWRWYGPETSLAVMFLVPTCAGMIGFARAASMDMLFSALMTVAVICAAEILREGGEGGIGIRVMFGAALGAAVLAKGPAAVVLVGGGALVWVAVTRDWRRGVRLLHGAGVAAFVMVATPWYVMCAMRNPEFVQVFLVSHNAERFLTPVFQHEQPWWFFVMVLVMALAPWTALVAGAARDGMEAVKARKWAGSAGFFPACFVIFTVVFFSVSKSKLPGYVLPAVPVLGLLMARALVRAAMAKERAARVLMAGVGATLVVLAASAGMWLRKLPAGSLPGGEKWWVWAVVVGAAGVAIAVMGAMRWTLAAVVGTALVMAMLVETVNQRIVPRLDARVSTRATAKLLMGEPEIAETVEAYGLDRSWEFGLNYYLGRKLKAWKAEEKRTAWVVTPEEKMEELRGAGMMIMGVSRVSREAVLVRVVASER